MLWGACCIAWGIAGVQSMLENPAKVNTGSFFRRAIQWDRCPGKKAGY